jgi:hypothetical protein
VTTPSNQPEIKADVCATAADATITNQKRLLLDVLRKHGVERASIAYNAFDGGYFPEAPLAGGDNDIPDTETLTGTLYGLPVSYSSAAHLMRELLQALLDLHHPGWQNDEGSEGDLDVSVGNGTFRIRYGERYIATEETETEV